MKNLLFILLLIYIFSCNSKHEQSREVEGQIYSQSDVIEKDSLLLFKNKNALFSGILVEKDSSDRILLELNYKDGLKHGQEIRYEYFYTDLPVVVLEGNWTNGIKSGIWKSHDGEGQTTVIKDYK
jgi:antitoxin component YwqK of YwqJK toxin-antitoxin module